MRSRRRLFVSLALALGVIAVAVANGVVLTGGGNEGKVANATARWCSAPACAKTATPSDVLRDRLDGAIELYRAGRVNRLLVSSDHRSVSYDEPNAMRRYLGRTEFRPRSSSWTTPASTYSSVGARSTSSARSAS